MVLAQDEQTVSTPALDGFAMPARFDPHARTLLTWAPIEEGGGTDVPGFHDEIEAIVQAITRFEPVSLIANPAEARERCGDVAEVIEVPIDTCWLRDCGPIFVRNADNKVAGVDFDFSGWGGRFPCDKTV